MSRQCLYCAKELPKSSASNFCSKECWTEYKKLKALNVGADRQATVMLKRSDLPEPEQAEPRLPTPMRTEPVRTSPDPIPTRPRRPVTPNIPDVVPDSPGAYVADEGLLERIQKMEDAFIDFQEYTLAEQSAGNSSEKIEQLESRISVLEGKLTEFLRRLENTEAMDNRLNFLEKRVKSLSALEDTVNSRGFFARLFS